MQHNGLKSCFYGTHLPFVFMKIALSGYRGFIGSALEKELVNKGHEIIRLSREVLYDFRGETLMQKLTGTDAVVHLAGAPILTRWTRKNREVIINSRVKTTRNVISAIRMIPKQEQPRIFITASAIGIYESGMEHTEESSRFAGHFAAQVTSAWEEASANIPKEIRRVVYRIGVVIDRNSQLIKQLSLPFRLGLGGPIGSGKQPMPFIHLQDVTGAISWALENDHSQGIYNLSAPENTDNRTFSTLLAKGYHRPAWIRVPGFLLKIIFGKAAQLVLDSPSVVPERLLREGYTFRFPGLEAALQEITGTH